MHKYITPATNLREYSMQSLNSADNQDLLLTLGARYILQSQLNKIKFSNEDLFRAKIKKALIPFFQNKIDSSESRVFVVKIWDQFSPDQYDNPDHLIKIHLRELAND